MKETLIKIAIFSVGVGVGFVGSMKYFDQKYQKLADEEIESCRKAFNKSKTMINEVSKPVKDGSDTSNVYLTSIDLEKIKAYHEYYAPKKVEVEAAQTLSPKEDEPFDISVEEYEEDTEFIKVTLDLYSEDGVLVYEETEEIADESSTIGVENLDDFARSSFSTAYFRNPKNNIDYELIKVDGSYRELIAGDI